MAVSSSAAVTNSQPVSVENTLDWWNGIFYRPDIRPVTQTSISKH